MQEDLEDATAQVIASGKVDPTRVAIFGLSYGGYAALMGAVRRPDLYKAVVAGAADADLLELLAFARRAAEIKAPVMLIHGDEDDVVTPKQSKLMANALKDAGKPYEYIQLKGEGHSGWSDDNMKLVLERATAFIAKHI